MKWVQCSCVSECHLTTPLFATPPASTKWYTQVKPLFVTLANMCGLGLLCIKVGLNVTRTKRGSNPFVTLAGVYPSMAANPRALRAGGGLVCGAADSDGYQG